LIRSNTFQESDAHYTKYLQSIYKVKALIDYMYFELIYTLETQQGGCEMTYKLFLHVLYEIETAMYFLNDLFADEGERICDHLKREVNRDRRKYEKVYFELNLNS